MPLPRDYTSMQLLQSPILVLIRLSTWFSCRFALYFSRAWSKRNRQIPARSLKLVTYWVSSFKKSYSVSLSNSCIQGINNSPVVSSRILDLQNSAQRVSKILKPYWNKWERYWVHLPGTCAVMKDFGLQNKQPILPEVFFQGFLNILEFNNIDVTMYPQNLTLRSVLPNSQIESPRLNHSVIHKADEVMQENLGKPHIMWSGARIFKGFL